MPPTVADLLKHSVKQTFGDPMGINKPMMPSSAKVVGICKGAEGNRTGVYGYSERASAIYGESPIFAGFFQGGETYNFPQFPEDDSPAGHS